MHPPTSSKEPSYIRTFKAATTQDPSPEDLEQLEEEMYGESDRTAVITLTAFLEAVFVGFIRKMLRRDLNADERRALFDYHGPLGSFSARIAVAYAVGL